jgi:hypothetical protein
MLSTRVGYGRPARFAADFAERFSDELSDLYEAPLGAARFHGGLADAVFFFDDRLARVFAGIVAPAFRVARCFPTGKASSKPRCRLTAIYVSPVARRPVPSPYSPFRRRFATR